VTKTFADKKRNYTVGFLSDKNSSDSRLITFAKHLTFIAKVLIGKTSFTFFGNASNFFRAQNNAEKLCVKLFFLKPPESMQSFRQSWKTMKNFELFCEWNSSCVIWKTKLFCWLVSSIISFEVLRNEC
jgi:hypothetical protein